MASTFGLPLGDGALLSGRWFESKSCIKLNILINVHVAQLDRAHAS